jgi:S1-C subfamily serine protease
MKRHFIMVLCMLLAGVLFPRGETVTAGKAYIWHDRDGNVHFSDQPPPPDQSGGDIEERQFKEAPKPEPKPVSISNDPIERAVQSTFRLTNRAGGGSGFFINDEGLAITAKHVVEKATYSMKAELAGEKKKYSVKIIKKSRKNDLALIQVMIDRPTPYLEIRKTDTLVRGEPVWVVGNPLLAFRETITSGNFSRIFPGKDFRKELKIKAPYEGDWVQFSAPVIGGNSGGPVVDKDGRLIGIVSLGFKAYNAINLAVPASYIEKNFAAQLQ